MKYLILLSLFTISCSGWDVVCVKKFVEQSACLESSTWGEPAACKKYEHFEEICEQ